jgi:hypothetical protein
MKNALVLGHTTLLGFTTSTGAHYGGRGCGKPLQRTWRR